ncbi:MAG: hypothetical protein M1827_005790 [Pycnora praestabilis]|nr:MAG: hypothetical protein M1827_005790 [Pycnora praestabilis]
MSSHRADTYAPPRRNTRSRAPPANHDLPARPSSRDPFPREPDQSPSTYNFSGDHYRPRDRSPDNMHDEYHKNEFSFKPTNGAPDYPTNSHYAPRDRFDNTRPHYDSGRQAYRTSLSGRQNTAGEQVRSKKGFNRQRGRGGKNFTGTHDRPLLTSQRGSTPEHIYGHTDEQNEERRYLAAADVSDSDEEEMVMGSDVNEDEGEALDSGDVSASLKHGANEGHGIHVADDEEPPRKKQALAATKNQLASDTLTPKWSNPDSLIALPPPDESHKKRKDVVKLIKKARISAQKGDVEGNALTENHDFISFDFGNDANHQVDSDTQSEKSVKGVAGAPSGPRSFSHLQNLHSQPQNGAPGTNGVASSAASLGPPPSRARVQGRREDSETDGEASNSINNAALGNRKRTYADEIKAPAPAQLPLIPKKTDLKKTDRKFKPKPDGKILKEWQPRPDENTTPWCDIDHQYQAENVGYGLHQEIADYYAYVKPRPFEQFMRDELVENLRRILDEEYPGCEVNPFGSFAAKIYLPNADMDLAVISKTFKIKGRPEICRTYNQMRQFSQRLEAKGVPLPGSVEILANVKVPLVKYVDKATGLKVDLSFENSTGYAANKTFKDWKKQYPAMPVIVMIIKQFLMMRGLSEVFTGGLGGFSVTCLVTSLLQNMPDLRNGTLSPELHYEELLLRFFDFYGNEFNPEKTGIQLNPPALINKVRLLILSSTQPVQWSLRDSILSARHLTLPVLNEYPLQPEKYRPSPHHRP